MMSFLLKDRCQACDLRDSQARYAEAIGCVRIQPKRSSALFQESQKSVKKDPKTNRKNAEGFAEGFAEGAEKTYRKLGHPKV